jgi:uncharacterized membrane protein YeaQ/YmgE (transglycosylase-associated protein family)
MGILVWIIVGFFAGLIARALMPGRQAMGLLATTLLGMAGSVVGGLVGAFVWGRNAGQFSPGGLVLSIIFAFLLLFIIGYARKPHAGARA